MMGICILSPTLVWGRVRRGGTENSAKGYSDLAAWRAALAAGISNRDIQQSYLGFNGTDRSVTLDLNHIRDLLPLDIQSVEPAEIPQMHRDFARNPRLADAAMSVAP
jgi:hypothetical protein